MAESTAWRDLRIRAISALVLGIVALVAIWRGGILWEVWISLGAVGMAAEWAGLCGLRARSVQGIAVSLCLLAAGAAAIAGWPAAALILLVGETAVLAVATSRTVLAQGILYIGPAYLALLLLRSGAAGFANVLFLMAVIWASDIGAYLVGRWIGGPKLAPRISPGKTWSGAFGGTLLGVLAGIAIGVHHPARAGVLALVLSLTAQAGDLLESAMKRHFGAKDSGWIIPGHGGLLDRLDGVLAAAPVALLWSLVTNPNATLWH